MPKRLCLRCGHVGAVEAVTPGSFVIEVILWLCFLVPGLIYSVWRVSSRYDACAKCGSDDLVPLDSPIAREKIAANPLLQEAEVEARHSSFRPSIRTIIGLAFLALIALSILGGKLMEATR